MTSRRAGTVAVSSVLAGALLVVLLVTWASSIGSGSVLRGTGPSPAATPSATESTASAGAEVMPTLERRPDETTPSWVRVLALVIDVAVVVALVLLAVWLGRAGLRALRLRRWQRRRHTAEEAVEFDVIEPPERVAREILADAGEQRQLLLGGTPRNAVVECWHRFETQAAGAGFERRAWETSSEFTMRVLDLVDASEPAVSRLGALYREARFSEHDLTEADRLAALDALDAIHRTIGIHA